MRVFARMRKTRAAHFSACVVRVLPQSTHSLSAGSPMERPGVVVHYKTPHQSLKAKNNEKRVCLSENNVQHCPPSSQWYVYTTQGFQRDGSLQLEHSRAGGAGNFQPGSKIPRLGINSSTSTLLSVKCMPQGFRVVHCGGIRSYDRGTGIESRNA